LLYERVRTTNFVRTSNTFLGKKRVLHRMFVHQGVRTSGVDCIQSAPKNLNVFLLDGQSDALKLATQKNEESNSRKPESGN
jgi:hypothetical protein